MRVIVAGAGSVGTHIAGDLVKAGHEVVVVEIDGARVAEAKANGDQPGVTWVVGCLLYTSPGPVATSVPAASGGA